LLTRRRFIARTGSAGVALVLAPQALAAPRGGARLTTDGFRYRLERGQQSIKGVNGPPA
jgi:hypothetical protein